MIEKSMILWFFLPTMFFIFDMLVYFLFGYLHITTIVSFLFFCFFNQNIPLLSQLLALFYVLIQASVFYNTVLVILIFCIGVKYIFSKANLFLKEGLFLQVFMTLFSMALYTISIDKSGLLMLKNYTALNFLVIMIVTLFQTLFLKDIYKASGQSNRLCKTRGKSGHQTGNVPFDKIRTGNKFC